MNTYQVVVSERTAGVSDIYVKADWVEAGYGMEPNMLRFYCHNPQTSNGRKIVAEFQHWLGYCEENP